MLFALFTKLFQAGVLVYILYYRLTSRTLRTQDKAFSSLILYYLAHHSVLQL